VESFICWTFVAVPGWWAGPSELCLEERTEKWAAGSTSGLLFGRLHGAPSGDDRGCWLCCGTPGWWRGSCIQLLLAPYYAHPHSLTRNNREHHLIAANLGKRLMWGDCDSRAHLNSTLLNCGGFIRSFLSWNLLRWRCCTCSLSCLKGLYKVAGVVNDSVSACTNSSRSECCYCFFNGAGAGLSAICTDDRALHVTCVLGADDMLSFSLRQWLLLDGGGW